MNAAENAFSTPTPQAGKPSWDAIYERGVERCRRGEWKEGLVDLAWLAKGRHGRQLPALAYSYLGYGLARYRGQVRHGIRLCQYSLRLEFYQLEGYVNLARAALLSKEHRAEAAQAVLEGLRIDPDHPELLELQRELGCRQPAVLPFLSRGHLLNRVLGWIRHHLPRRRRPLPQLPQVIVPDGGDRPPGWLGGSDQIPI